MSDTLRLADEDIVWRSHWLQQALAEDRDLAPPLKGTRKADVCIVGGGYLGLWTAIRLKEHRPGLEIVILERDICGGGASGRNSGMVLSLWPKFPALEALAGPSEAARLVRLSSEAIDGIERFCADQGIDCWFDRVGWIWGATCRAQIGAWQPALAGLAGQGLEPARAIERDEIAALTGSRSHLAGVLDSSAATIHPGVLARGLRRVARARGVHLYEKTSVRGFNRRGALVVDTPGGRVETAKLVLSMNAWSAAVPELAPAIFNIASDDAVSAPMPDHLAEIGYARGPLMTDSRVFVAGYRVTRDARLNAASPAAASALAASSTAASMRLHRACRRCGARSATVIRRWRTSPSRVPGAAPSTGPPAACHCSDACQPTETSSTATASRGTASAPPILVARSLPPWSSTGRTTGPAVRWCSRWRAAFRQSPFASSAPTSCGTRCGGEIAWSTATARATA